ncbi:MAG: C40 family peptidase [Actinobacteria bacterium]|nr:C40 family peptidase [Actinomycetota bacterium]
MSRKIARFLCVGLLAASLPLPLAAASPSGSNAQQRVDDLRTLSAERFESANEIKIQIARIMRETSVLTRNTKLIEKKRDSAQLTLSRIAVEKYRNDGFSDSFAMLFSGNPTQYLSDAAKLEIIGQRYAKSLNKYIAYQQRLSASKLVLRDRTAQLRLQQRRLNIEVNGAKSDLKEANRVLYSLKVDDRKKLLASEKKREQRILKTSKRAAKVYKGDSSRGSKALRFALQQIGDIYVWGGSGLERWDCSGLTLRAFQQTGVSLPHSSAVQFNYGKSVSYKSLKPGDLVFYGRPISHVAIYMGGGKMVQAPRAGKRVEVVSLTLQFGSKPFIGARRL